MEKEQELIDLKTEYPKERKGMDFTKTMGKLQKNKTLFTKKMEK